MIINKSKLILVLVIMNLLFLIAGVVLFKLWRNERGHHTRWEENYWQLNDTTNHLLTKNGNLATEARQLTFTIKDMKRLINNKDSALIRARSVIDNLDKTNKRLQKVIMTKLEAVGQGTVEIVDTVFIDTITDEESDLKYAEINDGYLFQDLYIYDDTIDYDYTYEEEIDVVMNMIRKPNKNGNQVFWLWRWLRPWVDRTYVIPENPNSRISVATQINFE